MQRTTSMLNEQNSSFTVDV